MAMSGKDELTPREREVLDLVLQRLTNEEIAARFVVDIRTVETHVSRVLQKMGYRSRRELWRSKSV